MLVLNSRDWSEIVWLPKISRFKNQPCNKLYPKKPTGMHWLGYNDAVSWLNKVKNSNISAYSQFRNLPVFRLQASLPASLP